MPKPKLVVCDHAEDCPVRPEHCSCSKEHKLKKMCGLNCGMFPQIHCKEVHHYCAMGEVVAGYDEV